MAQRYFGNTLSDLQSALSARDRLAAEQNIASQGNTVRFTQGMQQMAAQRAALQQQAAQQAAQQQIQQQQLAQSGYFDRGRLANEGARIAAEQELAKAQMGGVDRRFSQEDATRRYVADATMGARSRGPELASQENELATAAENFAGILNTHDKIQSELANLDAIDASRKTRGNEWFTLNSTAEKEAMPKLSPYFSGQVPQGVGYSDAVTQAKSKLQAQLGSITPIVAGGQQGPVASLVARTPGGRWVSTFKPGGGYFPRTSTQSGVAPTMFNQGTGTQPAPNRDALIQKIQTDFRNGVIDRATAEQGLRQLGLQ